MKNIIFLLVSVLAFSQNPNHQTFLDHNWRLNFVQDGDNDPVYVHSSINNYRLKFSSNNFVTTICNSHFLEFSYVQNENKFEKLISGSTLVTCEGQNNPINNLDFFEWFVSNFTNGSSLNSHYPFVLTPTTNNQYSLDIYNPLGRRLNFNSTGLSTENNSLNEVKIYPNPVSDILNISSNLEIKKIEIFQINGQKVFESESNNSSIDMAKMSAGVYFLKITDNTDGTFTRKILKK